MEKTESFEENKIKCLLWCNRHCCLCDKPCGVNIEIHHIILKKEGGTDEIDNLMPLCFDCHAQVEHYNKGHPKGSKFSHKELKTRREQIYKKYTYHLVPPVICGFTQQLNREIKRKLPNVGFYMRHEGESHPVCVLVNLEIFLGDDKIQFTERGYYTEKIRWHLNPRNSFIGANFSLPAEVITSDERLLIKLHLTIIDELGREHKLLPVGHVFDRKGEYWFAEP